MAKKITVVSGKGGTGKSTLCAVLAEVISDKGKRVLLVDCDIGLGSLDMMLGAGENVLYNWGDVISEYCGKDEAVLKISENCSLLASPPGGCDDFTEENFVNMIKSYEDGFDYIITDAPAGTGRGFSLAISPADTALIVTAAEKVSVRNASAAADKLFMREIPEIYTVLNKFDFKGTKKGARLSIDRVIDGSGAQLRGIIPLSEDAERLSVSFDNVPKKSGLYLAVERLFKRLCGEDLPLKRLEKM